MPVIKKRKCYPLKRSRLVYFFVPVFYWLQTFYTSYVTVTADQRGSSRAESRMGHVGFVKADSVNPVLSAGTNTFHGSDMEKESSLGRERCI
jgi:hypothetical protein